VEMYEDSPAMELIRRGRAEVWAEAEAKIAETVRKIEAEARRKEAEALRKMEVEARRKEAEARRKETEARRKEVEARRKEAEARQKAELEKKTAISKMINAGIEKAAIAEFLGLSRPKLAAYIRKIHKDSHG
ncbi:MAG: hypothetical protein SF052_21730, partial [Bacteroidia bacterium]|nr:hypothetical protein [Bacteroidia bacterium]